MAKKCKEAEERKDGEHWKDEEIEHIALPLPNFHYQHTPKAGTIDQDIGMVGRDNLISDLVALLHETQESHGSYLLAGFRGAGKTTLVNTALDIYRGLPERLAWLPGRNDDPSVAPCDLRRMLSKGKAASRHFVKRPLFYRLVLFVSFYLPKRFFSWLLYSLAQIYRWVRHTKPCIRRTWYHPLVHVHVNLATEGSLDARTVLFNTAFLLHRRMHEELGRGKRLFRAGALLVSSTFLLLAISWLPKLFYEHWPFIQHSWFWSFIKPIVEPLYALVSGFIEALEALLRSFSTLLSGTDDTNVATHLLHEGARNELIQFIFLIALPLLAVFWLRRHVIHTPMTIERRLADLLKRGQRTEEKDQRIDAGASIGFARRFTTPPLDAHRIEAELLRVLHDCRKVWPIFGCPDVIFVFDELDKISGAQARVMEQGGQRPPEALGRGSNQRTSEVYRRKERVDELLSTIKNFITEGEARFFFIAGRDMLDSYQSERGNASSLYESLFNGVFEVPSLLTDAPPKLRENITRPTETFVCRRLLDPAVATYLWYAHFYEQKGKIPYCPRYHKNSEDRDFTRQEIQYKPYRLSTVYHWMCAHEGIDPAEARRHIFMLRHFINFLTLHSWGNAKRLNSLFEHFIKPMHAADSDSHDMLEILWGAQRGPNRMVLQFGRMDQQRIMLASSLFVLVKHHLARQFSTGTDKLAVSLFAALQHLVKFHRLPFNRSHLERMDEALSIHRSPELNTALDTLINLVLRSHVRLIRNGLSRYRFMQGFEQEVRYISRISDIESAAFNFSLDSMAGVKLHYQERLRQTQESGEANGSGPDGSLLGAATIADIHISLGDLFTQEDSLDQAAFHFQEATDSLLPLATAKDECPDQLAVSLLPCVEALLKLGDVNERRQRYDRSAAAYTLAQSIAAQVLGCNHYAYMGASDSYASRMLDAAGRGDSKWDILKQPLWALRYLSLKRSPFPWADSCEPAPQPFYPANLELGAKTLTTDPVYHYRAGQLAFFNGRHGSAAQDFANAFKYSKHKEFGDDHERAAYLAGYALMDFAENLLVAFMRRQHILIRDQVRGRGHGETHGETDWETDRYKINKEFFKSLCKLIGKMDRWKGESKLGEKELREYASKQTAEGPVVKRGEVLSENVEKLLGCFTKNRGMINEEITNELVKKSELGVDRQPDPDNPLDKLDLKMVFSIMAQVARRFERHGLSLHATVAYLKLISLWTCLLEGVRLSLFEYDAIPPTIEPSARDAIVKAGSWLIPIREAAMRSVQAIDGHAFTETWYRIWDKDVPGWRKNDTSKSNNAYRGCNGAIKRLFNCCTELSIGPCERDAVIVKDLVKSVPPDDPVSSCIEPFTLYHSGLYQKILFVSAWQETLRLRVEQYPNPNGPEIVFPPVGKMVPSSIRSLLFAHWIAGRNLTWEVIRHWPELGYEWTKDRGNVKKQAVDEVRLYRQAALAAHNLYRAHYYIRQMCGNDQDVMFPSPASVFYSLWRLIHTLLYRELRKENWDTFGEIVTCKNLSVGIRVALVEKLILLGENRFREAKDAACTAMSARDCDSPKLVNKLYELLKDDAMYPAINNLTVDQKRYSDAVCEVRHKLSKQSDHATPGQYFDYRFVTERTLTYLRDVEQLGDLSSRARAAVLRGKYFLSDDYEDPRFHLDWSIIQMMAPSSALVREHIMVERKKIYDGEDAG